MLHRRYVYTLLENTEDAEDVVQELFLRLWKNRKQIEIRENVEGYLFRMAKHLALNELRSKPHFQELPGETEQAALSCSYEDTRVETEEFRRALFGCMDLLPERAKENWTSRSKPSRIKSGRRSNGYGNVWNKKRRGDFIRKKFPRQETKVSLQWHKSFLLVKQKFHCGENFETFLRRWKSLA